MSHLLYFVRQRWEEIVILGIALPIILGAVMAANWALAFATIVSVVLIYGLGARIADRRAPRSIGEHIAFRLPRRGIIFTVGKQIDTIKFALTRQKPEYIGLICSPETQVFADQIMAYAQFDAEHTRKQVVDVGNLREIHAGTITLIEWLQGRGLSARAMAVDVTGGMTTLSLGAFVAAEARQIDTQYVKSRYGVDNKVIENSQEGILVARHSSFPEN